MIKSPPRFSAARLRRPSTASGPLDKIKTGGEDPSRLSCPIAYVKSWGSWPPVCLARLYTTQAAHQHRKIYLQQSFVHLKGHAHELLSRQWPICLFIARLTCEIEGYVGRGWTFSAVFEFQLRSFDTKKCVCFEMSLGVLRKVGPMYNELIWGTKFCFSISSRDSCLAFHNKNREL